MRDAGDLGGEDYGGLLGGDAAGAEAAEGAAGGFVTDGDGVFEQRVVRAEEYQ